MASASDGGESDGTPTQPLLDALSTARFQQRLLSLVGEKEGAERRVQELERSVHHAEATLKAALDSRSEVQANLRASERRIQEAEAAADRHLAAVESEKQRYAILARLADDQAAESKAKISAQGEQLHVLNEHLGAANRAVGTLRAHQSSSDQHIESFHAKVSEVTLMLETVRAAERTCRGTVGRIVEEQSSARLQLSAIERTQASVVGRAKLVAQLKAAREVAKEKDALSSSRLEEMKVLMQELRKAKEGHEDALSVARKMRGEARGAESLLAKKDALLASQADQMEGALRRNMLLSETNDQLQAAARRNEVVTQLLLRELGQADALAHSGDRLAVVDERADGAEWMAARARAATLEAEVKASQEAEERASEQHAAALALLAATQDELDQCRRELLEAQEEAQGELDEALAAARVPLTEQASMESDRSTLQQRGGGSAALPEEAEDSISSDARPPRALDQLRPPEHPAPHGQQQQGWLGVHGQTPGTAHALQPEADDASGLSGAVSASNKRPVEATAGPDEELGDDATAASMPERCAQCNDELFGMVERCSSCPKAFHRSCVRRPVARGKPQGKFTCAACTPAAKPPKRSKNTLAMVKKNSLLA